MKLLNQNGSHFQCRHRKQQRNPHPKMFRHPRPQCVRLDLLSGSQKSLNCISRIPRLMVEIMIYAGHAKYNDVSKNVSDIIGQSLHEMVRRIIKNTPTVANGYRHNVNL